MLEGLTNAALIWHANLIFETMRFMIFCFLSGLSMPPMLGMPSSLRRMCSAPSSEDIITKRRMSRRTNRPGQTPLSTSIAESRMSGDTYIPPCHPRATARRAYGRTRGCLQNKTARPTRAPTQPPNPKLEAGAWRTARTTSLF